MTVRGPGGGATVTRADQHNRDRARGREDPMVMMQRLDQWWGACSAADFTMR